MRFLHTADWHVGRQMRGRSRAAEFEAVLAELVEIARAEDVEAMLVCGDIWDTSTPAPDADRIVYQALRECVGDGIQVVLLAGNHDSPRKVEALGVIADLLGIHAQSKLLAPDAGGVLNVEGREHEARIAALPFLTEGRFVDAEQVMGLQEDWFATYNDRVRGIAHAMCGGFARDTVNLLIGHLFIDGARIAPVDASERLLHIGQTYGVHPASLPPQPQYIALGHVHQPQQITSAPVPTYYAGSPLQLDFGERGQTKGVYIIDAVPGRPVATPRFVPLTRGRQLVELRGSLDAVLAQAEQTREAYVRVVLDVEQPEPGLAQRVRDLVPGAVDVRLAYERAAEVEEAGLATLTPEELFARYYRSQHGAEPAPELIGLFSELLREVEAAERGDLEVHAGEAAPGEAQPLHVATLA